MSENQPTGQPDDADALERARREKLRRWREELGLQPYGHRVDDLISLGEARAAYNEAAHESYAQAVESETAIEDPRPYAKVAGRVVQHRAMGKLVFVRLRDHSGDLQISISKADVNDDTFKLAKKLDYGDIIVAEGPVGATQRGEICVWATALAVHCKSLAPPPEKFHGLSDPEIRYRRRYVDMYATPETIRVFQLRSALTSQIRRFMDGRGYLEVETPIMQQIAGGAAARPFVTHHNALDIPMYLRVAPELYLKRLLVGGMPRVYEIARNFRNEGVDRLHNPEFTMLEVYQAFGDCETMLELTESMLYELAADVAGVEPGGKVELPYGDLTIDYTRPFARVPYGDVFSRTLEFEMGDEDRVRAKARDLHMEKADTLDHWLLVNEVYERCCESTIDPQRPTFVTDYPAAISPLTRPQRDNPDLSERWELLIGGGEMANAYTELNDPDIQRRKFTEQLSGADEEVQTFRSLDEDFLNALMVGMPPAGGMGLGIDRIMMLLTNSTTIRDVILFPLLRPE